MNRKLFNFNLQLDKIYLKNNAKKDKEISKILYINFLNLIYPIYMIKYIECLVIWEEGLLK